MSEVNRFPGDFLWGAATSAYQIEGSPLADGAGPSIWHRFAHTPGRTANGETGDVACDHYHRFRDDVALLDDLGLNAYRFSVSWSRILPVGRGTVNPRGLGFYDRLIDALLERRIQPVLTLYHWDLPAALDDLGGWLNPDSAHWFADYAGVLFRAFHDRVPLWTTLNEPWVVVDGGYVHGTLAPGYSTPESAPRVAHHLLRAHGAAVQAYRAEGRGGGRIGIVLNIEPKHAASDAPADVAAARRADAYMNRQYLEPVLGRSYPAELAEIFGPAWPAFPDADLRLIAQPIDFLGINRGHLRAALEAVRRGVNLRGYFAWSLLDNYEWSLGYSKRFGIVHVDFTTQRRTPKASARFYTDVVRTRGAALSDD